MGAIPPKNSCKTNKMIYIVTKGLGEKVIDRPTQTSLCGQFCGCHVLSMHADRFSFVDFLRECRVLSRRYSGQIWSTTGPKGGVLQRVRPRPLTPP